MFIYIYCSLSEPGSLSKCFQVLKGEVKVPPPPGLNAPAPHLSLPTRLLPVGGALPPSPHPPAVPPSRHVTPRI